MTDAPTHAIPSIDSDPELSEAIRAAALASSPFRVREASHLKGYFIDLDERDVLWFVENYPKHKKAVVIRNLFTNYIAELRKRKEEKQANAVR